ncbi:folate family ECF transporter S component [Terrisporobacter glycolicus]|uniref:Folate transporter FolT n=1 Tax=Terrisporobacter glycolicus ATCC 14880 = DSM 1288 TaxID=1121315 RepID=A0ABZ2ER67_9FIRM|nr:folate family ECF transporter S component [Terrisporobacter glycolicus]
MNKKFNVKRLVQTSLLVALQIILTRFCSIQTPIVRIGFGFLPVAIIAIMYGPIWSGVANGIADIIGVVLFPTGAFFPGFTLTAILSGIVYGVFLHNKAVTWTRIIGTVLVIDIILNLGLDTYWLSILMGKGFIGLLPTRLLKEAIMIPLKVITIGIVWKKFIVKLPKFSQAI